MKEFFFYLLLLLFGSSTSAQQNRRLPPEKESTIVYDTIPRPVTKMVYNYVGHMPQFDEAKNGSINAYLTNRISFPAGSPEDVPSRKVVVQFLIGESGEVSHPKIVKSAGLRFDSVAVRLVENMPDWIPARNDAGKAVPVRYTLPIMVYVQ